MRKPFLLKIFLAAVLLLSNSSFANKDVLSSDEPKATENRNQGIYKPSLKGFPRLFIGYIQTMLVNMFILEIPTVILWRTAVRTSFSKFDGETLSMMVIIINCITRKYIEPMRKGTISYDGYHPTNVKPLDFSITNM